jgi:hypothetical protein
MSVTKTADHSYFYLQKAKELANCNGEKWDRISKVKRDEDEYIARKMF